MKLLKSLLAIALCGVVAFLGLGAKIEEWDPAAPAPVSGGYGEAIIGTGEAVYLVKCLYASSRPEFYRYDPQANTWNPQNTTGLETGIFRNGTALAWDTDDNIYALVGARYKDQGRRTLLRYQITEQKWEELADTPHDQGAGDAVTWSGYDERLYAIVGSGKHNGGRSYFVRYDPETNDWTNLDFIWDTTEDGASLAWTGGEYLYALQGEYMETVPSGEFARFHIPSETWEELSPLPDPGGVGDGGSLLWIGFWVPEQKEYIFALGGGAAAPEDPGYGFYCYGITAGEWEKLEDIPCPVGYYVGNRLAFAGEYIYYWQGSPTSERFICGGNAFYSYTLGISNKPEFPNSKTIEPGGSVSGFLDDSGAVDGWGDQDWWKVTEVSKGDEIIVKLIGPASTDFDLCIWKDGDWSECDKGSSSNEKIRDIAGSNTWIWVGAWVGKGNYNLNLTLKEKAQVVINEIEQNPPCDDRYKTCMEWIEMYNPSETPVDISNWTVSTTGGLRIDTFQFYSQCSILKPNGYCVFGHSRWLDNNNESVILRDENRKEVDRTPIRSDNDNDRNSWQRLSNGVDTDSRSDWQFRSSTRGRSNS